MRSWISISKISIYRIESSPYKHFSLFWGKTYFNYGGAPVLQKAVIYWMILGLAAKIIEFFLEFFMTRKIKLELENSWCTTRKYRIVNNLSHALITTTIWSVYGGKMRRPQASQGFFSGNNTHCLPSQWDKQFFNIPGVYPWACLQRSPGLL